MIDIYYEPDYGRLYEKMEKGTCQVFEYTSNLGQILHMFIKRRIDIETGDAPWFDLVTPYGYGGPIIKECPEGKQWELIKGFEAEFGEYCRENRIVSEFIRFHPILENAQDFKDVYDVSYIRNTVGTNLADFEDPFQEEFSKSTRKNIRRALRAGITYKITENPKDIKSFKEIYYATMDRNEASDYYYFDEDYFQKCLDLLGNHVLLVEAIYKGQVVAAGLYFVYNEIIHIHLSGTIDEFLHLSPAYILRYGVTTWGKEKGYRIIHHGGGRSNSPEDGLYLFKKRFGLNTEFKFSTGKRIWDRETYEKLCIESEAGKDIDFFPAYRGR